MRRLGLVFLGIEPLVRLNEVFHHQNLIFLVLSSSRCLVVNASASHLSASSGTITSSGNASCRTADSHVKGSGCFPRNEGKRGETWRSLEGRDLVGVNPYDVNPGARFVLPRGRLTPPKAVRDHIGHLNFLRTGNKLSVDENLLH
jgi:hypothetical protein